MSGDGRRVRDVTMLPLPSVGFVLEQTLGHRTFSDNLRAIVPADGRIRPEFRPVHYERDTAASQLFGMPNWTLRSGIRARGIIGDLRSEGGLDALFIHTQVPAILCPDHLRQIPTVVSLDATPIQYDELGVHYQHRIGRRLTEHLKWQANRACFASAARIVTWSRWAMDGLVDRYDVPPEQITVIPPGVPHDLWTRRAPRDDNVDDGRPMRVLFVGGDLIRKGAVDLLVACRRLRRDGRCVEVHIASNDESYPIWPEDGVFVHRGLRPNSRELIDLYHRCDVFCLPSRGDCLPMVLSEASAAGLPLISTAVGALPELVRHGHNGFVVTPGRPDELAAVLLRLIDDRDLRLRMAEASHDIAHTELDATANAHRLVDVILAVIAERAEIRGSGRDRAA